MINVAVSITGKKSEVTLDQDIRQNITFAEFLGYTKDLLLVTASELLKDQQAKGFDKNPIVVVDGRQGKHPSAVHPLGQIEFIDSQLDLGEALILAYEGLLKRSKVLEGDYKASHYVFYNGNQVATDLESLKNWLETAKAGFKSKDIIRIMNIQPYARKLERYGVTAAGSTGKKIVKQKKKGVFTGKTYSRPNGTYVLTERSIKSRLKHNLYVKFSFITGASVGLMDYFKTGRKKSIGRTYLYPSLIFVVRERGIANV